MGNADGTNGVGYCYEKGIGVEKDENKSFAYYQKSAEMGTQHYMFRFCHPSLQIFDNKRMPYFHPFQLQFLFGNNLNNLQHYLLQLKIVIEEELELKKMNIRHSFIIKNLQKWGTLMECLQLQNVIEMELE